MYPISHAAPAAVAPLDRTYAARALRRHRVSVVNRQVTSAAVVTAVERVSSTGLSTCGSPNSMSSMSRVRVASVAIYILGSIGKYTRKRSEEHTSELQSHSNLI